MGDYTRLTFWAEIDEKNEHAVAIVAGLVAGDEVNNLLTPEDRQHPFFQNFRSTWLLGMSSYYHQTGQTLFRHDDIAHAWFLNVDCSVKDYQGVIAKFLDWLHQHDAHHYGDESFRGIVKQEEDFQEHPTLIYWTRGGYELRQVKELT